MRISFVHRVCKIQYHRNAKPVLSRPPYTLVESVVSRLQDAGVVFGSRSTKVGVRPVNLAQKHPTGVDYKDAVGMFCPYLPGKCISPPL